MSVRFAILSLLAQQPRHGYELHSAINAVAGGDPDWDVKPAQVYSTLNRLEESGFVHCISDLGEGDEPDRRIYEITSDGHRELQKWFASGVAPSRQRDELFIKLMAGLVTGQADPLRLIHAQRLHIYRELQSINTQRGNYDPNSEMVQILRLDKMILHLEAELYWLEMTEQHLEAVKKQPMPEADVRPRGRPRKE